MKEMEDAKIVALLLEKKEEGLTEAGKKYGRYLDGIASRFLGSREDRREAVNDALLGAWNSIPPHCPEDLGGYLAKLIRRICIDRLRKNNRQKRGSGQAALSLHELSECLPDGYSLEGQVEEREAFQNLSQMINNYLFTLPKVSRQIFISRYFYTDSIEEIASNFSMSRDSVKSLLYRIRKGLKVFLEKEGFHS